MNWTIFYAVSIALLTVSSAGLAGHLAAKETWHKWVFWGTGFLIVCLIYFQTRSYKEPASAKEIVAAMRQDQDNTNGKNTPPIARYPSPAARDIAAEIMKDLHLPKSINPTTGDDLMKVRADAASVINRLTETVVDAYRSQAVWLSRLPPGPTTKISPAQVHLNMIVQGFDSTYHEQYQQNVKKVYRELMGQINTVPPVSGPPRDIKYSDDMIAVQGGPTQGEDKVSDLCTLLTEMEKENNLTSTCNEIGGKLMAAKQRPQ